MEVAAVGDRRGPGVNVPSERRSDLKPPVRREIRKCVQDEEEGGRPEEPRRLPPGPAPRAWRGEQKAQREHQRHDPTFGAR